MTQGVAGSTSIEPAPLVSQTTVELLAALKLRLDVE
jgi:hypothetical protein